MKVFFHRAIRLILIVNVLLLSAIIQCLSAESNAPAQPYSQPSSRAQQLYASAQQDLLQLRVLLKNGNSQSAVGSGFLIGKSRLVVTNFHVISQLALEPETYIGEYKDTRGQSGSLELLAVDVLHDLAVVRIDRKGSGIFNIPFSATTSVQPPLTSLNQGERLYSLGNPLDLGFTISEGTYNGISARGFSDQLMFTGAVNPGMSGGPNVTVNGEVAGVNVAHRRDGELVSFLVPAVYVQALLAKITDQETPPLDFKTIIGEQLLQHQTVMVDKLLEQPFSLKALGPYQVPVRESDQVRCWGHTDNSAKKPYLFSRINCSMESAIFVSSKLKTGTISMQHNYIQNKELNALQFSRLATNMFGNQVYSSAKSDTITPAECSEDFIAHNNTELRALVCTEAYHKFKGLYDFTLTTASTDDSQKNVQSMMNIQGVSFANGLRLIRQFLAAIDRDEVDQNEIGRDKLEETNIKSSKKMNSDSEESHVKNLNENHEESAQ